MNQDQFPNLKWKADVKGVSIEVKMETRMEILRLKNEGVTVSELKKRFNISKPQLYRILENPNIQSKKHFQRITLANITNISKKERGRKTKIQEKERINLLTELIGQNQNSFPVKKHIFVKFLNEKEQKQEIPEMTNHVKYPEYNRFKTLFENLKESIPGPDKNCPTSQAIIGQDYINKDDNRIEISFQEQRESLREFIRRNRSFYSDDQTLHEERRIRHLEQLGGDSMDLEISESHLNFEMFS